MDFVIHGAFLETDIWKSRLHDVVAPKTVEITECNSIQMLMTVLEQKRISLLVEAANGIAGLKAVRQIREWRPEVPLLWISDEDFSLIGYQYRITYFLCKPVCDKDLRKAVECCLKQGEEKPEE